MENGFNNAFDEFNIAKSKKDARLTVYIKKADPVHEVTKAAVNQYGDMISAAVIVQITYQARLLDRNGNVLRRSSNTVTSKRASMRANEIPSLVGSAIESMYEVIAKDFFDH